MSIYKLEERSIKSIPGTDKEVKFDLEGLLGFPNKNWNPATGKGKIVLRYRYSVNGQRRKFKLGSYPQNTIKQLSAEYKGAAGDVAQGRDPQGQRQQDTEVIKQQKVSDSANYTVAEVGQKFVENHSVKKRSCAEDVRILNRYIIPMELRGGITLGEMPIQEVRKHHLIELHDKITKYGIPKKPGKGGHKPKGKKGAPIMANRVMQWASKFFNWADGRYGFELGFTLRVDRNKENKRTRVLSEEEIKLFWEHLDILSNSRSRDALKLVLLTAARPGECASIHSTHVKDDKWIQPEYVTKSDREHLVPLAPMAKQLVQGTGYIFPSPRTQHTNVSSLEHDMKKVMNAAGIHTYSLIRNRKLVPQPTPHDLRRTAATYIESKYGEYLPHRILNHAKLGLSQYTLHEYEKEKTEALRWWDRKLMGILDKPQSNVIQLSA